MHCAALRTRATGQPASTKPSAAEPATADAASAAIGGARDTCQRLPFSCHRRQDPPATAVSSPVGRAAKEYSPLRRTFSQLLLMTGTAAGQREGNTPGRLG